MNRVTHRNWWKFIAVVEQYSFQTFYWTVYEQAPIWGALVYSNFVKKSKYVWAITQRMRLWNGVKTCKTQMSFSNLVTLQVGSSKCHSLSREVKSSAFSLVSPILQIKSSISYWLGKCGSLLVLASSKSTSLPSSSEALALESDSSMGGLGIGKSSHVTLEQLRMVCWGKQYFFCLCFFCSGTHLPCKNSSQLDG